MIVYNAPYRQEPLGINYNTQYQRGPLNSGPAYFEGVCLYGYK